MTSYRGCGFLSLKYNNVDGMDNVDVVDGMDDVVVVAVGVVEADALLLDNDDDDEDDVVLVIEDDTPVVTLLVVHRIDAMSEAMVIGRVAVVFIKLKSNEKFPIVLTIQ